MPNPLSLDLASKRQRQRTDYPYREDYRTRWYATNNHSPLNHNHNND
jgi:hypothetical protein